MDLERSASPAPAEDLPELATEIWINIFEYLSSSKLLEARLVCRRFNDIVCGSPSLFDKLVIVFPEGLTIGPEYHPGDLPRSTKARFKGVCIMEIGPFWESFGVRLTEIQLIYGSVIRSDFRTILQRTPNLKCLEVIKFDFIGDAFEQADFHLEHLVKFTFEGIIDARDLIFFRELCSRLKSLKLVWSDCSVPATPMRIATFLENCQDTLEELHITCTHAILAEILRLDRLNLKKLVLKQYALQTCMNMIELCRKHSLLNHLETNVVLFVSSNRSDLNEIGQLLPHLKLLSISFCHVDLTFLYNFPMLQTLELRGNEEFTIIEYNGSENTNLRQLHLHKIHFQDNCMQQHLAKIPNLETFKLNWCKFNNLADLLMPLQQLNSLRILSLHGVNVNEGFSPLPSLEAISLTGLKHLYLAHCELSPWLMVMLLNSCRSVRELHLEAVCIENEAVEVICEELTQLTVLTIRDCALTRVGEQFLRENVRSLELQ